MACPTADLLRASASASVANIAIACQSCQKTQRDIQKLREKIKRLTGELEQKTRLLTEYMDTAATQSEIINILNSHN